MGGFALKHNPQGEAEMKVLGLVTYICFLISVPAVLHLEKLDVPGPARNHTCSIMIKNIIGEAQSDTIHPRGVSCSYTEKSIY